MKELFIFGAGYAGLMAAHYFSSKGYKVTVLEKKREITSNHSALFRFKEDISNIIPIKLEKVIVRKNIYYKDTLYNEPNIKLNNLYSYKTTGKYTERSIMNLDSGVRFIPSATYFSELIELCKKNGVTFVTGYGVTLEDFIAEGNKISTLPLPVVLNILGIDCKDRFESKTINTISVDIKPELLNLHQTIYFPQPQNQNPFYRISIIGNRIVGEFRDDNTLFPINVNMIFRDLIFHSFGINREIVEGGSDYIHSKQKFGKLIKIGENKRKELVYTVTKMTGAYLLGRFATWRQIMTPEVIKDILRIEQWFELEQMSNYDKQKAVKL